MILQPQASFTVVRQIPNHLDTDTNYVKAVIRNAYTDDIIDTLQLTDKGSQRFKKDWQVPADPSGQGFYISIVTSVYTDSGYTTKNPNYGDDENTYLVQERVKPLMRGGGSLDAYTVRRIVKEEIAHIPSPEPVKIPKPPVYQMRWDDVLAAIADVKGAIKPVNLVPLLSAISDIRQAVDDKEITPQTDLQPIADGIESATRSIIDTFTEREDAIAEKVVETIRAEVLSQLQNIVKDTNFTLTIPAASARMNPPSEKQPQPVPFDPKSLAL